MAASISLPGQRTRLLQYLSEPPGLTWHFQILVFFICALAVVSRLPCAVLNPEFYAEDGAVWYSDAYQHGWLTALSWPAGGYLNTLQRLVAAIALPLPFHAVPLAFNLMGIALQVLPVNVLLSNRCSNWGSLPVRLLFSIIYIALPNAAEVHIFITNSQFHFALLSFLLATASVPRNYVWKIVEVLVLAIFAVSGPFCFVLLPLVLFFWWIQRETWHVVVAGVLAAFGAIQAFVLFSSASTQRLPVNLGANFPLFIRLLGGRVFMAAIWGGGLGVRVGFPIVAVFTVISTALVFYCLFRAPLPLRLFTVFAACLLAASLARPLVGPDMPGWQALLLGGATRYWFFPTLAFLWCLAWCATNRTWMPARVIAICAMLVLIRGIKWDWRLRTLTDEHFQMYAAQFEAAKPGDILTFPIYPPSVKMRLRKK